jgi:hypothetical protein
MNVTISRRRKLLNISFVCSFALSLLFSAPLLAADYLKTPAYEAHKVDPGNIKVLVKDDEVVHGPFFLDHAVLSKVEFFQKAFNAGMQEEKAGEITLNMSFDAFNIIINYLFLNEAFGKFVPQTALEFIQAANFLADDTIRGFALENLLRCPAEFASLGPLVVAFAFVGGATSYKEEERHRLAQHLQALCKRDLGKNRKEIRDALRPKELVLDPTVATALDSITRSLKPMKATNLRLGWREMINERIAAKLPAVLQTIDDYIEKERKRGNYIDLDYSGLGLVNTSLRLTKENDDIRWATYIFTPKDKYVSSSKDEWTFSDVTFQRLRNNPDLAVDIGLLEALRADLYDRGFLFEQTPGGYKLRISW